MKTTVRSADKQRFLEFLRAHLVIAGGIEQSNQALEEMSVGELMELTFNNRLTLMVMPDINMALNRNA